jgi:hypothetical protein
MYIKVVQASGNRSGIERAGQLELPSQISVILQRRQHDWTITGAAISFQ